MESTGIDVPAQLRPIVDKIVLGGWGALEESEANGFRLGSAAMDLMSQAHVLDRMARAQPLDPTIAKLQCFTYLRLGVALQPPHDEGALWQCVVHGKRVIEGRRLPDGSSSFAAVMEAAGFAAVLSRKPGVNDLARELLEAAGRPESLHALGICNADGIATARRFIKEHIAMGATLFSSGPSPGRRWTENGGHTSGSSTRSGCATTLLVAVLTVGAIVWSVCVA